MVGVSVWAGMSNENKEKVVERMARRMRNKPFPREAVTVNICEAPTITGQPVDSCVQRSTQIVSVRGMKGKDRIQTRWTS